MSSHSERAGFEKVIEIGAVLQLGVYYNRSFRGFIYRGPGDCSAIGTQARSDHRMRPDCLLVVKPYSETSGSPAIVSDGYSSLHFWRGCVEAGASSADAGLCPVIHIRPAQSADDEGTVVCYDDRTKTLTIGGHSYSVRALAEDDAALRAFAENTKSVIERHPSYEKVISDLEMAGIRRPQPPSVLGWTESLPLPSAMSPTSAAPFSPLAEPSSEAGGMGLLSSPVAASPTGPDGYMAWGGMRVIVEPDRRLPPGVFGLNLAPDARADVVGRVICLSCGPGTSGADFARLRAELGASRGAGDIEELCHQASRQPAAAACSASSGGELAPAAVAPPPSPAAAAASAAVSPAQVGAVDSSEPPVVACVAADPAGGAASAAGGGVVSLGGVVSAVEMRFRSVEVPPPPAALVSAVSELLDPTAVGVGGRESKGMRLGALLPSQESSALGGSGSGGATPPLRRSASSSALASGDGAPPRASITAVNPPHET